MTGNKYLFSPYLGEMGWEIFDWSGYVRAFKRDHPDDMVLVPTREERLDLYTGTGITILPFNITDDYVKFFSNLNLPDNQNEKIDFVIPEEVLAGSRSLPVIRNVENTTDFRLKDLPYEPDYNYTPRQQNGDIINLYATISRRIVTVAPRLKQTVDGKSMDGRNWPAERWQELYEYLAIDRNYIVFIAGVGPAMVKPKKTHPNLVVLEDFIYANFDTSAIGLTIEAIRQSKLTIGQQSAIPVLSNLLRTPTLIFGHQRKRLTDYYNPYGTQSTFVDAKQTDYSTVKVDDLIFHLDKLL